MVPAAFEIRAYARLAYDTVKEVRGRLQLSNADASNHCSFCSHLTTQNMLLGTNKMASIVYKPGDLVPGAGVYRIEHHRHRLMHEATLDKDMLFPQCRTCGNAVRFTLVHAVVGEVLPFRPTAILVDYPVADPIWQATG